MNLLTQIFDYLNQFFDEFITAYIVLCIIGVIFYVIAYSYIYLVGSIIVWLEKNVKNKKGVVFIDIPLLFEKSHLRRFWPSE